MIKKRVLLVEDDRITRLILAEALKYEGFDVIEFDNGEDAVNYLGNNKIEAVIADVQLNGRISGLDVGQTAKALNDNIKVIIITSNSNKASLVFESMLLKPVSNTSIIEQLHNTLICS